MTGQVWKTDCGTCRHACMGFVRVGDTAYGNDVEDWACDMEDRMNDDDVELSNQGRCPFWSPDMDAVLDCVVNDLVENKCHTAFLHWLGIGDADALKEAVARRRRIREVGDMLRDPDYHDIIVEMVHELEDAE